jgi:peptidoglycan/xylan/chitin deacetylase (PgdA/CDA1 family)
LAAESGVIVLYHHVDTSTPPSTSISPEDFRRHLEYLRDNDYQVMALDTMIDHLQSQTPLPERAVAITFDDGYASIYETAFPILQQFDMPFTLFLSTDPINQRQNNYMTWDQVRELSDAGAVIANHMVYHPYMLEREDAETDAQWLARQREELLDAEATIEAETGQDHRFLAYPYGEFNAELQTMLAEEGFVGFAQNSGAAGFQSDFLALPRYPLASIYANLDTARTKFASLAFNVELLDPLTPVTTTRSPGALLKFNEGKYNLDQIGCFADGEPLTLDWEDKSTGLLRLSANREYSGRRWRYICTAPLDNSGRYFWYSLQWIKPN